MNRFWRAVAPLIASLFVMIPGRGQDQPFQPGCTLAFDSIKVRHVEVNDDIDLVCPIDGKNEPASDNPAHTAQNRAKNNFCATGPQIRVNDNTFVRLQKAADQFDPQEIPWGSREKLPPDRSKLKGVLQENGVLLGEGTLVTLVAFVMEAHPARGSEAVNCMKTRQARNDTHILLSKKRLETDKCKTVTAEISPHFRPLAWGDFHHYVDELRGRPVKLSGQLFFDASHRPCRNGQAGRRDPARKSVWEIHPVYSIDVCKNTTLANCKAGDPAVWTAFDVWVAQLPEEDAE